jgi:hypothetical protein
MGTILGDSKNSRKNVNYHATLIMGMPSELATPIRKILNAFRRRTER